MNKSILIVDDDIEIVDLISIALKNEGFQTYHAFDGQEATEIVQHEKIHLIILDVMMPRMDGLEFCTQLRKKHHLPVLMVSAKSGDLDKIHGLMTGADDYLTKPFNLLELVMRVKALIRRAYFFQSNPDQQENGILHLDSLTIDRNKYRVTVDQQEINLTAKEFEILYLLASHRGQVFSAEKIFQTVWKERYYESNNTVMVHISNLREKLDTELGYRLIHTVWGVGYKIE